MREAFCEFLCLPGQHIHITNGSKSPRNWHGKQQMEHGIVFAWHEHTCAAWKHPQDFYLTWPIAAKSGPQKRTLLLVMTILWSHPWSVALWPLVFARVHLGMNMSTRFISRFSSFHWDVSERKFANLSQSLDTFLQTSLHVRIPLQSSLKIRGFIFCPCWS